VPWWTRAESGRNPKTLVGKRGEDDGNALVPDDGDDGDEDTSCVGAIFYFTYFSRAVVLSGSPTDISVWAWFALHL
jgi:hypothetical protein